MARDLIKMYIYNINNINIYLINILSPIQALSEGRPSLSDFENPWAKPWVGHSSILQFIVSSYICVMTKFSYGSIVVSTAHVSK